MIDLKRSVYEDFKNWKSNHSNRALFVKGARQVGKTYIVNKFAKDNYKQIIYINLSDNAGKRLLKFSSDLNDKIFADKVDVTDESFNLVYELIKLYDKKFVDSKDTVIIIDEIQESSKIFNRIRNYSGNLISHVIIIGSYLGRIKEEKGFRYSAGDYESIEIRPLSFLEFLDAFDLLYLYNTLDLYGDSKEDYNLINKYFKIYLTVGGYPAIVREYIEFNDTKRCEKLLKEIVDSYWNEASDYFNDIIYKNIFEQSLINIAKSLVDKEKGSIGHILNENLQMISNKDNYNLIGKDVYRSVMFWLYKSKIVKYCGKAIEGNIDNVIENQKYYFNDLGITNYLLTLCRIKDSDKIDILNECFVFDCLERNYVYTPTFAAFGNGEFHFIHLSYNNNKIYGIQVEARNNFGKEINQALRQGKINYALYVGESYGGINDKGTTIAIPIYLLPRFKFDIGGKEKNLDSLNIF